MVCTQMCIRDRCKTGFAHTGTSCQNDQIAAAKAGKHGILSSEAGIDSQAFRTGALRAEDWE